MYSKGTSGNFLLSILFLAPRHSHSHKMNQLALLGLSTDQNERFLYPLIYFNKWNPYPLIHLNPEISTPFGRSLPPRIDHYREYSSLPLAGKDTIADVSRWSPWNQIFTWGPEERYLIASKFRSECKPILLFYFGLRVCYFAWNDFQVRNVCDSIFFFPYVSHFF